MAPNLSYLRAGLACLPFTGPLVSMYNMYQLTKEYPSPVGLIDIDQNGNLHFPNNNQVEELGGNLEAYWQRAKIYCTCGVVGHALTIAGLASFVAIGIFNAYYALLLIAGSLIDIRSLRNNLHKIHQVEHGNAPIPANLKFALW